MARKVEVFFQQFVEIIGGLVALLRMCLLGEYVQGFVQRASLSYPVEGLVHAGRVSAEQFARETEFVVQAEGVPQVHGGADAFGQDGGRFGDCLFLGGLPRMRGGGRRGWR